MEARQSLGKAGADLTAFKGDPPITFRLKIPQEFNKALAPLWNGTKADLFVFDSKRTIKLRKGEQTILSFWLDRHGNVRASIKVGQLPFREIRGRWNTGDVHKIKRALGLLKRTRCIKTDT